MSSAQKEKIYCHFFRQSTIWRKRFIRTNMIRRIRNFDQSYLQKDRLVEHCLFSKNKIQNLIYICNI